MYFIDTHAHLYLKQFTDDRVEVVRSAINDGIEKILLPNICSKTTKSMLDLCDKFPNNCYPMMGLHPCDVKEENFKQEITHVKEELEKGRYVGVGEIGIDLYWDKSTLLLQKEAFSYQINLAKEYQLPVAIHVRNSFEDTIEIVEQLNDKNLTGVFHCFTGNKNDAQRIIDLEGFYLGIGGVVTFKNSGLDKTVKEIPIQNIVLETDSPFLTPSPFRGKRNESKYILKIAEKIADIKNLSIHKLREHTTANAKYLFKKI